MTRLRRIRTRHCAKDIESFAACRSKPAAIASSVVRLLVLLFAGGLPALALAATVVVQVRDRNGQPVPNAVAWAMPVGAPIP